MLLRCTDIQLPPKSAFNLKFRIIVRPNGRACAGLAQARKALANGDAGTCIETPRGGLSEIRSGVLIRRLLAPSASCASRADPMLVLKRGGVEARAMILKLALATATDAGAVACRCPAWTRSAMGDRCGAVR